MTILDALWAGGRCSSQAPSPAPNERGHSPVLGSLKLAGAAQDTEPIQSPGPAG